MSMEEAHELSHLSRQVIVGCQYFVHIGYSV